MCYLIYEESGRVDERICGDFGPVQMVDCDEGETATGYEGLCWALVSIAIVSLSTLGCMYPSYKSSLEVMRKTAIAAQIRPSQFGILFAGLIAGIAVYVYFIVLAVYQSSCGDTSSSDSAFLPQGEVVEWRYDSAERVLIFFTVLMALWCFSFVSHAVEYVTGGSVMQFTFRSDDGSHPVVESLKYLIAFHLGTVLLAAVLIPLGRLPRNLLLGLRTWMHRLLPRFTVVIKPCEDWYHDKFKYMTSDGLAYQTFSGKSLISAFKESVQLFDKHEGTKHSQALLNNGNYYIWLSQLTITMTAPVFTAYWIHFESRTFGDIATREVTSVTAMSFFALFFSWFLAQLYGGFARGLLHAHMFAYLLDLEYNGAERKAPAAFRQLMGEDVIFLPKKKQVTKPKDDKGKDEDVPSNSIESHRESDSKQ